MAEALVLKDLRDQDGDKLFGLAGYIADPDGGKPFVLDRSLPIDYASLKTIRIDEIHPSEYTFVFIGHVSTDYYPDEKFPNSLALKMMRPLSDQIHGDYTKIRARQLALQRMYAFDATHSNNLLGIARIAHVNYLNLKQPDGRIDLDYFDPDPSHMFDPEAEYVICQLGYPQSWNLNNRLQHKQEKRNLEPFLYAVNNKIAGLHISALTEKEIPLDSEENPWGTARSLKEKLVYNLSRIPLVLEKNRQLGICDSEVLEKTLGKLQERMLSFFEDPENIAAIKRRKAFVRHCHGDLHPKNIFIEELPGKNYAGGKVLFIDSLDFNSAFYNIDILSDYAMLIPDILALTDNEQLVENMIEDYLIATNQTDSDARKLLEYYLIEKTWVRIFVNYLFNNNIDKDIFERDIIRQNLKWLNHRLDVFAQE